MCIINIYIYRDAQDLDSAPQVMMIIFCFRSGIALSCKQRSFFYLFIYFPPI